MKNAVTRKSSRSPRKKAKNSEKAAVNGIASPERESRDLEKKVEAHSLHEHHVLPGEEDPEINHPV